MIVKIESEDELIVVAEELIHASVNMRYWQKQWEIDYGAVLLNRKRFWEAKMDELIGRLAAGEKLERNDSVKINIQKDQP